MAIEGWDIRSAVSWLTRDTRVEYFKPPEQAYWQVMVPQLPWVSVQQRQADTVALTNAGLLSVDTGLSLRQLTQIVSSVTGVSTRLYRRDGYYYIPEARMYLRQSDRSWSFSSIWDPDDIEYVAPYWSHVKDCQYATRREALKALTAAWEQTMQRSASSCDATAR